MSYSATDKYMLDHSDKKVSNSYLWSCGTYINSGNQNAIYSVMTESGSIFSLDAV
jgi:hypothetical protein